jgi:hypothetical protein
MIETAIRISGGTMKVEGIEQIIQIGKELIDKP